MSVWWSTKLHLEPGGNELEESTDGEWQLVDAEDWWRTPFSSVCWSFSSQEQHSRSPIALPLFIHISPSSSMPMPHLDPEDIDLNPNLVGYKLALDVVSPYEKAVGFDHVPFPTITREDWGLPPSLNLAYTEEDVLESRDHWRESVEELLNAESECSLSLSSSMTDSARSEHSFAMPATPVTKASYANVLLKNVSPSSSVSDDSSNATPPKTLNAFASSFVPSTEASGLSTFTFPTLNPPNKSTTRLTTVKIKKDDQGFFTDVQVEDTPQPLPLFLQEPSPRRRTRTSKTREIVDRLRSSQADNLAKCISHSPSPIFHDLSFIQPRLSVSEDGGDRDRESSLSTPSFDEDEDGWIDVGVEVSSSTKAKRARDLFLALTRRRTDSTSSEPSKDEAQEKAGYAAPNSDGWIEGLPSSEPLALPPHLPTKPTFSPAPPKVHRKKHQKFSSTSISPVSPTQPTFPTYMGVPILNPPHMTMMPPAPAPVTFFFSPAPPPYHAVPLPYPTAPPAFLAPPFGAIPLHPMAGYPSKRSMNSLYPVPQLQPRKSTSVSHSTFGKAGP